MVLIDQMLQKKRLVNFKIQEEKHWKKNSVKESWLNFKGLNVFYNCSFKNGWTEKHIFEEIMAEKN